MVAILFIMHFSGLKRSTSIAAAAQTKWIVICRCFRSINNYITYNPHMSLDVFFSPSTLNWVFVWLIYNWHQNALDSPPNRAGWTGQCLAPSPTPKCLIDLTQYSKQIIFGIYCSGYAQCFHCSFNSLFCVPSVRSAAFGTTERKAIRFVVVCVVVVVVVLAVAFCSMYYRSFIAFAVACF